MVKVKKTEQQFGGLKENRLNISHQNAIIPGQAGLWYRKLGCQGIVCFFFSSLEINLRPEQFKPPSLRSVTLYFPTRQAFPLGWG